MTDQQTEIQIHTNRKGGNFRISDRGARGGQITVNVTEEKHWDPLSKAFKKYTHNIVYKFGRGSYQASDYNITVYGPRDTGTNSNKFMYINPELMVRDVEVYFWADAKPESDDPLIVGFIIPNWKYREKGSSIKGCKTSSGDRGSKCYYTWTKLKSTSQCNGDINVHSISEKDLISGLLEELGNGTRVDDRQNKLVIRLGEKPGYDGGQGGSEYPASEYFKDKGDRKIKVSKDSVRVFDQDILDNKEVPGYVKYEHTFTDGLSADEDDGDTDGDGVEDGGVEDLYVSYGNDSRFFKAGSGNDRVESGSEKVKIKSVDAYYYTGTGRDVISKNPVLITFYLTSGSTFVYPYHDFVNDLKGLRDASDWLTDNKIITGEHGLKTIDQSGHGESGLLPTLQRESERLRPLIEFRKGGTGTDRNGNQNITTIGPQDIKAKKNPKITFKKFTMKPNTKDVPEVRGGVPGSSVGPWTVYNTKLFTGREPGANIKEGDKVLTSMFTNDVTNSRSSKYKSINVYYFLKSRSDYKALLVEFEKGDGSGTKIYIKRKGQSGTEWEKATDIGTDGTEVTAEQLNQIGTDAKIIEGVSTSSSSVDNINPVSNGLVGNCGSSSSERTKIISGQQIHIEIETNKKKSYTIGDAGVPIKVTPETPWDPLSKAFNKYTHTIKYPESGCYKSSDSKITVYGQGGFGFTYENPSVNVEAVEFYFRFIDNVSNKNPLVVGFVYSTNSESGISTRCKGNICHYTWADLTRQKFIDGTITYVKAITPQDLVTVLLEIGSTVSYRKNQHVIRLDETPGDAKDGSQYPSSEYFKDSKITVKKSTEVDGFEKYDRYVHTIDKGSTVDEFYVTYERNSRYFMTATRAKIWSWSWLGQAKGGSKGGSWLKDAKIKSVTAYYKAGTGTTNAVATSGNNSKKLLLITFYLTSGSTYVYPYSEFINELESIRSENKIIETELARIGTGGGLSDSELKSRLTEESEKLKPLITFVNHDGDENEHISKEESDFGDGKFKKVILKTDNDYAKNGSYYGPWKVYKNQLFTRESGMKIEGDFLEDIASSKYSSINVFYNLYSKDYKALLVEFVPGGCGRKKYFKRGDENGNKWDSEDYVNTSDTGQLTEKLTQIIEDSIIGVGEDARGEAGPAGIGVVAASTTTSVIGSPGRDGNSSSPRLPSPSEPRESEEATAASGPGGDNKVSLGAADPVVTVNSQGDSEVRDGSRDNTISRADSGRTTTTTDRNIARGSDGGSSSSSTAEIQDNNTSQTITIRRPSSEVNGLSITEDGRLGTSDNSGGSDEPDGAGSTDDSNNKIGEAVGGGVSLLVASGSTGFGIYRYRHFFLH